MASLSQLRMKVEEYLDDSLDLEDFEDWFLSNTWNAHLDSEHDVVKAVHRIEGALLDFSAGAISSHQLRLELRDSVRPLSGNIVLVCDRTRNHASLVATEGLAALQRIGGRMQAQSASSTFPVLISVSA